MDQDETWHGVDLVPGHIVFDGNPTLPLPLKGHSAPRPVFRPVSVVTKRPAGCIKMPLSRDVDLDPDSIVLYGTQLPSPRGHSPQFSTHVCYGQTAGWIKLPLATDRGTVGLGPGDIVLDGDPAIPPKKGHSTPTFRPMSIVAVDIQSDPSIVQTSSNPCN